MPPDKRVSQCDIEAEKGRYLDLECAVEQQMGVPFAGTAAKLPSPNAALANALPAGRGKLQINSTQFSKTLLEHEALWQKPLYTTCSKEALADDPTAQSAYLETTHFEKLLKEWYDRWLNSSRSSSNCCQLLF